MEKQILVERQSHSHPPESTDPPIPRQHRPSRRTTCLPRTKHLYHSPSQTMPSDHHNNHHHHHTSRSTRRSRSPRDRHHRDHDVKPRHRSRSPRERDTKRHDADCHRRHHSDRPSAPLPFSQPPLRRHHLPRYRALFASYLDLQKNLDISTLSETELKGRWKSFVGKWNRGELAEGWYEPGTKERADERAGEVESVEREAAPERRVEAAPEEEDEDEEDEDELGPALPAGQRTGPSAPTVQDLREREEAAGEERAAARADLRFERKAERRAQKERLEELVPRAEPGSRERQLEKKRDAAAANRAFAEGREAGGAAEVPEADVMGGGDGVEEYRKQVGERQRAKNEREVRKEEQLRAREVEREERLAEHRRKEDKTMEMLRALAQQRYG